MFHFGRIQDFHRHCPYAISMTAFFQTLFIYLSCILIHVLINVDCFNQISNIRWFGDFFIAKISNSKTRTSYHYYHRWYITGCRWLEIIECKDVLILDQILSFFLFFCFSLFVFRLTKVLVFTANKTFSDHFFCL